MLAIASQIIFGRCIVNWEKKETITVIDAAAAYNRLESDARKPRATHHDRLGYEA